METEDPAAIPGPGRRIGPGPAPGDATLSQIAGAVSALAGRVDRMGEAVAKRLPPQASRADRESALDKAREFIVDAGWRGEDAARVQLELAIARYLTGE